MSALPPKYGPRYRALADRLREAREDAGFTQVEAAKRLGRHQSFVSKCEAGERRIDVIELEAFARLYGKDFGYFETNR